MAYRRLEPTVGERLDRLRGAARIKWLDKWRRWLTELTPEGVDPAELWGSPLLSPEDVEGVLREYCRDLTNGECFRSLSGKMRREAVTRLDLDPYLVDRYAREAELLYRSSELLDLEYPVARVSKAEEILDAYRRRDIGGILEAVESTLKYDYYLPEADVRREVGRVRERLERIVPAPGKHIPIAISKIAKTTGAHYMCIIRKLAEKGVDIKTEKTETLKQLGEECVREGKIAPLRKYLLRLSLKPPSI